MTVPLVQLLRDGAHCPIPVPILDSAKHRWRKGLCMSNSVLARVGRALLSSWTRFNDRGGWVMSSHVAMSVMLALFPFVLFIVALAATLSQNIDIDSLIELVFGSWPDEIAAPITNQVRKVVSTTDSTVLTLGGVLAIYFSSNGVDAVRKAMVLAYRETDERPFWRTRLLSLTFVIIGGAGVLVAGTVGVALPIYVHFFAEAVPGPLLDWLDSELINTMVPLVLLALGVAACHMWLPGKHHTLQQVLPGVLLTLFLWGVAGAGFSYYLARFASYSATYAGLAGVMAALIFLYLMSAILIFGAQFNEALSNQKEIRQSRRNS